VSLLALTTAYAALADGGLLQGPVFLLGEAHPRPRRVYSPEAAFLVGDILSDNEARGPGFGHDGVLNTPYPSSVKTGTSSNFKDNWCVGYTDRHVVGVWAGNFSAQPMTEVSGVTGAGQLWRKAMDILANRSQPKRPKPPRGLKALPVCPVSGLPAGPDCPSSVKEWFLTAFPIPPQCRHREMGEPRVVGQPPGFHLISPRPGEIYAYDPGLPPEQQRLRALAHGEPGVDELVWILNGRELGRTRIEGGGRASLFLPLERGPNRLEVLGLRAGLEPLRAGAAYSVK
jgi:penicillin-binding protein 1C